jgi:cobalt-zinc-cadmium efflux system protein
MGVNGINVRLLHRDSHADLNLRGVFLHVLADVISSVGVIVAAIVVATLHWLWADGAVSVFVAGLILLSAVPLIAASWKNLES